jgi:uncharacterized membrane protein
VNKVSLLLAVLLLSLPMGFCAEGIDPRRVSVLYLGDALSAYTPYIPFVEDASISVSVVWVHHHGGIPLVDIERYVRLYMPRSYDEYADKYDALILSNAYRRQLKVKHHRWFRDGVLEHGIGLVMVAGQESFGASSSRPDASWAGSLVEEVLPVTVPTGIMIIEHNWIKWYPMEVVDFSHEFISSLPFEPRPEYMRMSVAGQLTHLKEGATLLARWLFPQIGYPPLYATWDIGEGRTFAMTHEWADPATQGGGYYFAKWDYYGDFAINLVHYLAKRSLPTNYVVVHQYREQVHALYLGKGMLLSLIDFVDAFGGDPTQVNEEIRLLDEHNEASKDMYLDHNYQGALDSAREAMEKVKTIEKLAIQIKNQALLWVYITEWLAVTGTGLLCGFVVWTLMVRRRLYREIETTRLRDKAH